MKRKFVFALLPMLCFATSLFGFDWGHKKFVFQDKTYPDILHLAAEYLPENPIVLEAGANDGTDTLKMSKFWPEGYIYTFEPQAQLMPKLQEKLEECKNVTIFPLALNSYTGTATFYQNAKNDGSSSLLEAADRYRGVFYVDTELKVPCITLSDWMVQEEIDHIDFIWLDIEGAELFVLQHSGDLLNQAKVIFIEMNFKEFRKGMSQYRDVAALLEGYGFRNLCMRGLPNQKNALFVKRKR